MSEDANDVRSLDALVGEWSMEAVFPLDPPVTGRGRVSFEWLSEDSFLVQRWEVEHRNASDGIYRRAGSQLLVPVTPNGPGYSGTFEIGLQA